jgi:MFS family permease
MHKSQSISTLRVLLPISIGTCLSLLGDTSLYTVLPTHITEAGILLANVGILLSANRWVRLPLNGPAGFLIERWPRKPVFVLALFLGVISTTLYAVTNGFWPLFVARLLWGIAWVGIWIGGNTIVMDISTHENRGRRVGIYQMGFFIGAGGGAFLGGVLTDLFGYHTAMGVNAALSLAGALLALIFLPETRMWLGNTNLVPVEVQETNPVHTRQFYRTQLSEMASATALLAVTRLAQAGFLMATFGLLLQQNYGEAISFSGMTVGVATLTGLGLAMTTFVAMITAPISGSLADRTHNRWRVAVGGLVFGAVGYGLLTFRAPAAIIAGLIGTSIAAGTNTNLSTTLMGGLGPPNQQGRRLGILFTVGDLASAVGPPLAYWLMATTQLEGVYWTATGVCVLMGGVTMRWSKR